MNDKQDQQAPVAPPAYYAPYPHIEDDDEINGNGNGKNDEPLLS